MQNQNTNQNSQYFRFKVFKVDADGKPKSVGMSYLRDGQNIFTLRLWMFSNERYYMIPNKNDASKYLIMTREPNKSPLAKNKYFWNIVGNGTVDSVGGIIELDFDLLEKPIYMNIHPESSAYSSSLAGPEEIQDAA